MQQSPLYLPPPFHSSNAQSLSPRPTLPLFSRHCQSVTVPRGSPYFDFNQVEPDRLAKENQIFPRFRIEKNLFLRILKRKKWYLK